MRKKYTYITRDQIVRARLLRRYGASLDEIASELGVPLHSMYHHIKDVTPDKDGQRKVYREISDLIALWKPGLPFKQLPIPRWMELMLEERRVLVPPVETNGELELNVLPPQEEKE